MNQRKRVLIIANEYTTILNFRMELLNALYESDYDTYLAIPNSKYNDEFRQAGCVIINIPVSRKGKNPINDFLLFHNLHKIITQIKPAVVLTYTIKPNVYGGLACRILHIPYISTITGLGTAVEGGGIIQRISLVLYRFGLKDANMVFFQNEYNMAFFHDKKIVGMRSELIPGSGVNLSLFQLQDYPETNSMHFIYVARAMKEKGIDQYLEAAKEIKKDMLIQYFMFVVYVSKATRKY